MTNSTSTVFKNLSELISTVAEGLAPPRRMSVSQAAEEYRYVNNPGSYRGPWRNPMAPYLVEPMDTTTDRHFSGIAFCGPAQSGKTDALDINYVVYSVMVDPMDMIIYSPTNTAARDFSIRRIDRLHRHSEKVGAMLLKRPDADNKFDKQYSNGMLLSLSWPSVTEFAGKPIPRVVITDYDRIPDDIDGDGNAFDLASKRTTSFMSFAMCVAESSPSRDLTDTKWIRSTRHEAPPVTGILSLYNRGDRRRWYWPCPHCGHYFEGNFRHLKWDQTESNLLSKADTVRMECPACDHLIHPDQRYEMQQKGHWVKDGQSIDRDGVITGDAPRTLIASFWLNGVAAMFTDWYKLVQTYIQADDEYKRTGSEEGLKKFYNNDLGEPYVPKSIASQRTPEELKSRSEVIGTRESPVVPFGTRFLLAAIDVQLGQFKVQVHAILPGTPCDIVVIDRFDIRLNESGRKDGDGQIAHVRPGTYAEDWDLITSHVLTKTYPLADGSGRRMSIKATGCDSGGKAGVTAMAYAYYRRLRDLGHAGRFQLIKGTATPGAPRTHITYPDASDGKNMAAARGDVPVMMVQSNIVKDMLSNRLDSVVPGKGMIRFSDWLPDWFFEELVAETRTDKGWENKNKRRNEAWDLLYYTIAMSISGMIKVEQLDWNNPVSWAAPWDTNSLVSAKGQAARFTSALPVVDWEKLGAEMA
jgi:phage terminase large subunit GpA-like protein